MHYYGNVTDNAINYARGFEVEPRRRVHSSVDDVLNF